MCGYCSERIALELLRTEVHGNLQLKSLEGNISRYFYFRETQHFSLAFDRLRRWMAQEKMSFFSEVPAEVLLYRGLELLIEKGFDFPAYQHLLTKPLYREAINICCSTEARKEFELLTKGLQIEPLGLLYEAATYYWGDQSKQMRVLADALPACRNLLKHYISWWLNGKKPDKRKGFNLLIRAFYFSILFVGSCQAGKKILLAIAQKYPAARPSIDNNNLWLQRVAALKLYDLEGFDAFCRHITTIRATNYYYIDLVRRFSSRQKQELLDQVKRHPEADNTDNFIRLSDWLSTERP